MRPPKHIPRSSAFAALRQFPRLSEAMSRDQYWREHDEWGPEESKTWERFLAPVAHEDAFLERHYLGYAQNDANALGARSEGCDFILTINHYDVQRLASVVSGSWNRERSSFPVELRFRNAIERLVLKRGPTNGFQTVRNSVRDLSQRLDDVHCIARVESELPGKSFVVEVNGGYSRQRRFSATYLFLIRCEDLVVTERLAANWKLRFPDHKVNPINSYFEEGPFSGMGLDQVADWLKKLTGS